MEMPTTISALPVAAPGIMRNNGLNSMHSRKKNAVLRLERPVRLPLSTPAALSAKQLTVVMPNRLPRMVALESTRNTLPKAGNSVLIQQPRFARHGEARAQCAEEIVDQQHDDERNKTQFEGAENIHLERHIADGCQRTTGEDIFGQYRNAHGDTDDRCKNNRDQQCALDFIGAAVDRDFEIRQQQGDGQTDQPQLHAFIAEIDEAAILTRSGQAAGIQANAGNQQAHRTADADLDVFGQAPCKQVAQFENRDQQKTMPEIATVPNAWP